MRLGGCQLWVKLAWGVPLGFIVGLLNRGEAHHAHRVTALSSVQNDGPHCVWDRTPGSRRKGFTTTYYQDLDRAASLP